MDAGKSSNTIDATAFPNNQLGNYWSSITYAANTTAAWYVFFNDGNVYRNSKTVNVYVRCVSGSSSSVSNFTDNNDGTVTDSVTKLVWQKCSKGQDPTTCSNAPSVSTWEDAISYCNSLSLASKAWRLPNRNELQSIVDYTRSHPSIDTTAFPNSSSSTVAGISWSSTPLDSANLNAFLVIFNVGYVSPNDKTAARDVRCVSGP